MAYLHFRGDGRSPGEDREVVSYSTTTRCRKVSRTPDDHLYLQTVASEHGIFYSRRERHLHRSSRGFGAPGKTICWAPTRHPHGRGSG